MDAPRDASDLTGATLGRFVLEQRLAARTYRAYDPAIARHVIICVDATDLGELHALASTLSRLALHQLPGVPATTVAFERIIDVGRVPPVFPTAPPQLTPDTAFVVCEPAKGTVLAQLSPTAWPRAQRLQALDAVAAALSLAAAHHLPTPPIDPAHVYIAEDGHGMHVTLTGLLQAQVDGQAHYGASRAAEFASLAQLLLQSAPAQAPRHRARLEAALTTHQHAEPHALLTELRRAIATRHSRTPLVVTALLAATAGGLALTLASHAPRAPAAVAPAMRLGPLERVSWYFRAEQNGRLGAELLNKLDDLHLTWQTASAAVQQTRSAPSIQRVLRQCLEVRAREYSYATDGMRFATAPTYAHAIRGLLELRDPSVCKPTSTEALTGELATPLPAQRLLWPTYRALEAQLSAWEQQPEVCAHQVDALQPWLALFPALHAHGDLLKGTCAFAHGKPESRDLLSNAGAAAASAGNYRLAAAAFTLLARDTNEGAAPSREPLAFVNHAEAAAAKIGTPSHIHKAILLAKSYALYATGEWEQGHHAASYLLRLAQASDDRRYQGAALQALASYAENMMNYAEAATHLRGIVRLHLDNPLVETDYQLQLAFNLALSGQPAEALVEGRAAMERSKALLGDSVDLSVRDLSYAVVLHLAGQSDEALRRLRLAQDRLDLDAQAYREYRLIAMCNEADILSDQSPSKGLRLFRRTLALMAQMLTHDSLYTADCHLDYAKAALAAGQLRTALTQVEHAQALYAANLGPTNGHTQRAAQLRNEICTAEPKACRSSK